MAARWKCGRSTWEKRSCARTRPRARTVSICSVPTGLTASKTRFASAGVTTLKKAFNSPSPHTFASSIRDLPGHRPFRSRGDQLGVLRHHAGFIAWLRRFPLSQAGLALLLRDIDIKAALLDIEDDGVAVAQRGDRTAAGGLGRDMAGHEAMRCPGEAAVGEQRDRIAQAGAHQRRCRSEE